MKSLIKIQKLAAVLFVSIALAGATVFAQSADAGTGHKGHKGGFGRHHRHGNPEFFMMNRLDLNESQKAQIKQFQTDFHANIEPIMQQMRAGQQEIRQAMKADIYNEELVRQKLIDQAGLKAKMMGEQFKLRQNMRSVLTAEQKTQIDQMKEQFKSRHSGRQQRDF